MGRIRIRFRLFVLLIMLASMVAATIAVRVKAGYRESALDHARRADQARARAAWTMADIIWSKEQLQREWSETDRARWQARIKVDQADQAKALAEAERHEGIVRQFARYYEP